MFKFLLATMTLAVPFLASSSAHADHFSVGFGKALDAYDGAYNDPTNSPHQDEGFGNRLGHVNNDGSWTGQGESLGRYTHGDGFSGTVNDKYDKGYAGSNAGGGGSDRNGSTD